MKLGHYSEDKMNIGMMKFLLLVTRCCLSLSGFFFSMDARDRLHHLIVAIPAPSIFGFQIINYKQIDCLI